MQSNIRKKPKPNPNVNQTFAILHKAVPPPWLLPASGYPPRLRPNVRLLYRPWPLVVSLSLNAAYCPWMLLAWAYKFISWKPVHDLYQASLYLLVFSGIVK